MLSIAIHAGAAIAEITGCFAFWPWLRTERSPLWLILDCLSLVVFAYLLTRVDSAAAGRAYAAYGGIYITFAVLWLWGAEGVRPYRRDLGGSALCLLGAAVIFLGPHRARQSNLLDRERPRRQCGQSEPVACVAAEQLSRDQSPDQLSRNCPLGMDRRNTSQESDV